MKIKIVRHGETNLNKPVRRMQGCSNYDLNENGVNQAKIIRDKLAEEKFDMIICSPLTRAKHTAEIINEKQNVEIIFDDRLVERNYGNLEGQEFKNEYLNLDYAFEEIGGESLQSYKGRVKEFINFVKEKYSDKKVLLVAHNGIICIMSCILEGDPENGNLENRCIGNGEIKEFEF